ncbi:MAG: hypothetical protein RLZZ628_2679 [Bacteroidota bacterium]|jgi:hypothetical protein
MKNKILTIVILVWAHLYANAQQVSQAVADALKTTSYFPTVQNKESNNIIINSVNLVKSEKKVSEEEFNAVFDNLASIDLYRQVLSETIVEKDFEKVGSSVFGKLTPEKMQKILTKEEITELTQYLELKSTNDLVPFINANPSPAKYKLMYNAFKIKQLLGFAIADNQLQTGTSYLYKVIFVDKKGSEKLYGYSIGLNSGQNNVVLNRIKPTISKTSTNDSLVICNWKYRVDTGEFKNFMTESEKLQQNIGIFQGIKSFTLNNLVAQMWIKSEKGFIPTEKRVISSSPSLDSLEVSFSVRTYPEDLVDMYIVLHDDIGNQGFPSDTAHLLAVDPKQVPIVKSMELTDIIDGMRLTWKQLPNKPYYRGVEITRFGEHSKLDTVAILSPTDTAYTDYAVKVGVYYTYNVRALYKKGYDMEQKVPAQSVGTNTKFSKPSAVTNLTAANEGQTIKLSWSYVKNTKFFGYYLYRGLSPLAMDPIAGPLTDSVFIDSSETLNGRTAYHYYLVVKDLIQQNSKPSNSVSIKPNIKVASASPYNLKSEIVNQKLYLNWVDVKKTDTYVKGYIVRRTETDTKQFVSVTPTLLTAAYFIDSTAKITSSYQYQVASINFNGDTSVYSEILLFAPAKVPVDVVLKYNVRNLSTGIEVSWDRMVYPNRKNYTIYKTTFGTNQFVKIGAVQANEFLFIDKNVEAGKEYVYSITITDIENREGAQAQGQTIIRE